MSETVKILPATEPAVVMARSKTKERSPAQKNLPPPPPGGLAKNPPTEPRAVDDTIIDLELRNAAEHRKKKGAQKNPPPPPPGGLAKRPPTAPRAVDDTIDRELKNAVKHRKKKGAKVASALNLLKKVTKGGTAAALPLVWMLETGKQPQTPLEKNMAAVVAGEEYVRIIPSIGSSLSLQLFPEVADARRQVIAEAIMLAKKEGDTWPHNPFYQWLETEVKEQIQKGSPLYIDGWVEEGGDAKPIKFTPEEMNSLLFELHQDIMADMVKEFAKRKGGYTYFTEKMLHWMQKEGSSKKMDRRRDARTLNIAKQKAEAGLVSGGGKSRRMRRTRRRRSKKSRRKSTSRRRKSTKRRKSTRRRRSKKRRRKSTRRNQ